MVFSHCEVMPTQGLSLERLVRIMRCQWRRPEIKMARTVRSIFLTWFLLYVVLFSTAFLQLINFVTFNLNYKSPKIQCNYVCDKEIIPYACPPFLKPLANTSEVCSPTVSAHNLFHLKLLANVRKREWNAPLVVAP